MIHVEIDVTEIRNALGIYKAETGKAWPVVIKEQGRLFLQRMIILTHPKTQAQGRAAVKRDIRKVFTNAKGAKLLISTLVQQRLHNLDELGFSTKFRFRKERIQKVWENRDWEVLEIILRRAATNRLQIIARPDPAIHQAARGSRGRVAKNRKPTHLVKRGLVAYIAEVQKRVGTAKAGWLAAANYLDAKFPNWISRHGPKNGAVQDQTAAAEPAIIMINYARSMVGVEDEERIVETALAGRARDMVKHAEKLAELAAKKAGLS